LSFIMWTMTLSAVCKLKENRNENVTKRPRPLNRRDPPLSPPFLTRLGDPVADRASDSSRGTTRVCTDTAAGLSSSLKARFKRPSASSSASLSSPRV
jgi:hypothetical protein